MSALSAAKAVLEADATLLVTATGGVWDWDETGRMGINRTANPSAFDSVGIIKPCVLLKLRSSTPDYVLQDDANQYQSVREIIECWLYQDSAYTAIETMKLRIYTLLHAAQLAGTFRVRWAGDTQLARDMDLDAFVLRSDYLATVKRSV